MINQIKDKKYPVKYKYRKLIILKLEKAMIFFDNIGQLFHDITS